jgi:hypothetical protein
MGSAARRSVFVGALCTGVAMLGVSVHGLVGIDADLQRSAFAARQQQGVQSIRVVEPYGDCRPAQPPAPKTRL